MVNFDQRRKDVPVSGWSFARDGKRFMDAPVWIQNSHLTRLPFGERGMTGKQLKHYSKAGWLAQVDVARTGVDLWVRLDL